MPIGCRLRSGGYTPAIADVFGTRRAFHFDPRLDSSITWNATAPTRIVSMRDVRGASYPLVTASGAGASQGVQTNAVTINGRRAYDSGSGTSFFSGNAFSNWTTEAANDWLYGVVIDVAVHGYIFDVEVGRLLIGTDQYYYGSFVSTGGVGPRTGIQVITAEFRAGVGTVRSHKTGGDTTIVCTGAYTQKGIAAANSRALMGTYIATTPANARYGECVLVRAPAAGEAATLGSLLLASYGL